MCEQADGEKDQSWPEISSSPCVMAMHDDRFFAVFGGANVSSSVSKCVMMFLKCEHLLSSSISAQTLHFAHISKCITNPVAKHAKPWY